MNSLCISFRDRKASPSIEKPEAGGNVIAITLTSDEGFAAGGKVFMAGREV